MVLLAFSSPRASQPPRRFQPSPFRPTPTRHPASPDYPTNHPPVHLLAAAPRCPRAREGFPSQRNPPCRSLRFDPSTSLPLPSFVAVRPTRSPYIVVRCCLPPLPAPSCRTSAFQPLTYPSANQQPLSLRQPPPPLVVLAAAAMGNGVGSPLVDENANLPTPTHTYPPNHPRRTQDDLPWQLALGSSLVVSSPFLVFRPTRRRRRVLREMIKSGDPISLSARTR